MRSASAEIGAPTRIDLLAHRITSHRALANLRHTPVAPALLMLDTVAYLGCPLTPADSHETRHSDSLPLPRRDADGQPRLAAAPEPGGRRGILDRRLAALGPLPRRDAPARRPVRGARRARSRRTCSTTRPSWCSTAARSSGRSTTLLVRILPPEGVDDRPAEAALRHRRSARRPRPRHRRLQGRQRDRRGDEGRPSVLLHRLPARPDARPDHRGHRPRRGGLPRDGHRPPSRGRGQALRHRQLPGRLGGDDARARSGPSCSARSSSPARRCPTGPACAARTRCATRAACSAARWLTALDRRPRRRHLRRRLAGAELREPEPGQHALDQAVQPLVQDRHRARALPRLREVVGRPRHAERRGDAVDRRRALRRQQAGRRRDPHLRRHRDRPAQHPLADRGLLLEGRQHHAAAAGARLDPRPLRQRRRHPRLRPDHRLHHPRQDRPPRHLRLRPASRGRSTTSSPRTST